MEIVAERHRVDHSSLENTREQRISE